MLELSYKTITDVVLNVTKNFPFPLQMKDLVFAMLQAKNRGGKLQKVSITVSSKFIQIKDVVKQVYKYISTAHRRVCVCVCVSV